MHFYSCDYIITRVIYIMQIYSIITSNLMIWNIALFKSCVILFQTTSIHFHKVRIYKIDPEVRKCRKILLLFKRWGYTAWNNEWICVNFFPFLNQIYQITSVFHTIIAWVISGWCMFPNNTLFWKIKWLVITP